MTHLQLSLSLFQSLQYEKYELQLKTLEKVLLTLKTGMQGVNCKSGIIEDTEGNSNILVFHFSQCLKFLIYNNNDNYIICLRKTNTVQ